MIPMNASPIPATVEKSSFAPGFLGGFCLGGSFLGGCFVGGAF